MKINTENKLILQTSPASVIEYISDRYPEIQQHLFDANMYCHKYKGAIQPYQAAVLYYLAKDYNYGNILEIGTGVGYSTYFLASACPNSNILTLSVSDSEIESAVKSLYMHKNIEYAKKTSREWFVDTDEWYDLIFVDGNHKDITFDLKWFYRLNENGLIIFHDYTDETSQKPCLPVFETLNIFRDEIAGDFDVFVKDSINNYGMVGWYR